MKHTVDTLMALVYKIRDARTYEWDVSEVVEAGKVLRKALTEVFDQLDIQAGSIEAVQAANQRMAAQLLAQSKPAYGDSLITALQENEDPVSIDAAEELQRIYSAQPVVSNEQQTKQFVSRNQAEVIDKAAQPVREPAKVYLVATGEVHEGQETYTRHDAPVPLADYEVLYTVAQPVQEPLNKSEWPKHPSAYVNDEYMGYSKLDLDAYAMQVLRSHGIGIDK